MENELTYSAKKILKREHDDAKFLEGAAFRSLRVDMSEVIVDEGPPIGEGAFAEVKLGKWLGIDVACKFFTRGKHFHEYDAFIRELEIHALLRHPNIIIVLGVSASPSRVLLTEYLHNGTLRDLIRDAPHVLTPLRTHKFIYEMALGMHYLHSIQILHRDLRAGNVLVSKEFVAKIGDFNLACREDDRLDAMGAVPWMAPEVLLSVARFTKKADVYSFAMTVWELFSLRSPPRYLTLDHAVEFIVKQKHRPSIPEDRAMRFTRLIEKCWSHEAEERPHFDAILDALHGLAPDVAPSRSSLLDLRKLNKGDEADDDYPEVLAENS